MCIIVPCFTLDTNRTLNVYLVSWINNPPYYIQDGSAGLVSTILNYQLASYAKRTDSSKPLATFKFIDNPENRLETESELISFISESNKTRLYERLRKNKISNDDVIVFSSTIRDIKGIGGFVKRFTICKTNKAILVVRKKDLLLLTQFANGIVASSGIIFFAITIAVNLAAIIWFIERNANSDFENDFGTGLWTSVWYCFVTLTTVGYGDKVPKHFFSRILCLAWMLFGLMLTALITANVLQAMQNGFTVEGKKIGMVAGQIDENLVVGQLNGIPVIYPTLGQLVSALREEEVEAAIIEGYQAGYLLRDKEEYGDLMITNKFPLRKSVFVYILNDEEKNGVSFKANDHLKDRTESVIKGFVPPYIITKYYVRGMAELFDVTQDGGLVMGFALSGCSLIMAAIFSQFLASFPKRRILKK